MFDDGATADTPLLAAASSDLIFSSMLSAPSFASSSRYSTSSNVERCFFSNNTALACTTRLGP
jgi:hypothetical protein